MREKILIIIFLAISSSNLLAQIILTREGTVVNNTITGSWAGVNIPRSAPTIFTYRNNSITSVNSYGYMLQAGDEVPKPENNNLDGEVITGNRFNWKGAYGPSVITHGVFLGYNINSIVKYNYLENVPYGIIFKSGTDAGVNMTFTSGGCAYNICKNGKFAGRAKGINGVKFYNNTFYSGDGHGWYLLLVTENMDRAVPSPSIGTKIFNNIFYSTKKIPMIKVESGCLTNFESDYNVFWCSEGDPIFNIDGVDITWDQWRAYGYDSHSRIVNPNFINTIDFVPAARLDFGKDLGAEWQSGLSTTATWVVGSSPATTNQNGNWQVGARIYSSQSVPVTSVTITGAGGATSISTDNGTLQLSAEVLPENASDKMVIWSIANGTGQAEINANGLVTAIDNGTVTVRATARDGSGVYGTFVISISNQVIPVSGITVRGSDGASTIFTEFGTLQLSATILPSNATNKTVTWSVANGTGQATISSTGLLSALSDGTVIARATANDGSGSYGLLTVTIASKLVPVKSIIVTGVGNISTIYVNNGTLQLIAQVSPSDAENKTLTWTIANGTGLATISSTGLVSAKGNGTVTARATANDGSGVYGALIITISNQIVPVTSIIVTGTDGINTIHSNSGSLQLIATLIPVNATDQTVTWSIINETGEATISATGLVTAVDYGTVTARATANDGSGIYGSLKISITDEFVPVTDIVVSGEGGAKTIDSGNETLQLSASVFPTDATYKNVTWSVVPGTGHAIINSSGLVKATDNGTVTAIATATDGSEVFGALDIDIAIDNPESLSIIVTNSEIKILLNDGYIPCYVGLYNMQGSMLKSEVVTSDIFRIDIYSFPPGIYILTLSQGAILRVEKIIKI